MSMWFNEMMAWDGEEAVFEVAREPTADGVSFSAEALDALNDQMMSFAGSRLMRRWNQTNEPPTLFRVEMRVTVA